MNIALTKHKHADLILEKAWHQLVPLDSSGCIAIYKVHVYRDYVQLWHALGYTPDNLCPEEEFNQAPL